MSGLLPLGLGEYLTYVDDRAGTYLRDEYKYRSLDTSPISTYATIPFLEARRCGESAALAGRPACCRTWLAPNLMTFSGFVLLLSNAALVYLLDPTLDAGLTDSPGNRVVPALVWFWCAFAQFSAHTLDGCDGMQARKTGSSSPLGELFDHGCDSLSTASQLLGGMATLGAGSILTKQELFLACWAALFGFYFSHWEKYNTAMMFLPWAYDFSQLTLAATYAATGVLGVSFWRTALPLPIEGVEVSIAYAVFVVQLIFGVATIFETIQRILDSVTDPEPYTPRRKFYEAVQPLVPLMALFGLTYYWTMASPADIVEQCPVLFYALTGLVFSNITCRLIVCQMTGQQFYNTHYILAPLPVVVYLAVNNMADERSLLMGYTALAGLMHLHYGVGVVGTLAKFLKIDVFTIKQSKE